MDQEPAQRVALMSIRPPFAAAIMDGTKTVEFRKRRLADGIRSVVVYVTAPVMEVVGEFDIHEQVVGTPADLWDRFESVAGIDREGFFSYFDGNDSAVGIVIDRVRVYDAPCSLDAIDPGGRPPQSFKYLAAV